MRGDKYEGSALIVVLWVIIILSIVVGSFTFDAHIEARITSFYRKRMKAEYLARSGIEVAELLMIKSHEGKKKKKQFESEDEQWWQEDAKRLSDGVPIHGLERKLGDGKIILDIIPEPARRNVNLLKEEDWERILDVAKVPEEMWPELVESFYDWIDRDDESRIDGAETEDYYATLDSPYMAKNAPLDTVGELLLIKGFSRTILSGGTIKTEYDEGVKIEGIEDMLTTYGDGKVNINAAGKKVLMTLPDVDDLVAGAIIEEREGWIDEEGKKEDSSFEDVSDLFERIPDINPTLKNYITTDSTIYRVTSIGSVHGVEKKIWCIVTFSGKKITILRWREED